MFVFCPECHQQAHFSDPAPLRSRCACGHVWTAEDTALATGNPGAAPLIGPMVRDGLVHDGAIVYHEAPAPIIELYRNQRSWSYIVRAIDHLVATLSELEDQIGQNAYGLYDWRANRFADVGNLSDISNQAVAAFVTQFRNLPADRQTILRPYLTWAVSVVKRCADTLEPRLAAAWAETRHLRDAEAIEIAENDRRLDIENWQNEKDAAAAERKETRSARWGLLGAAFAVYEFGRFRGRRND